MDQELQKLCLYSDKKGNVDRARSNRSWAAGGLGRCGRRSTQRPMGMQNDRLNYSTSCCVAVNIPLALFGQMLWSLRRYATATESVLRQLRHGRKADLPAAMKQAGFRTWGGGLHASESRIRQLGSKRAGMMMNWLLEADLALKEATPKKIVAEWCWKPYLSKWRKSSPRNDRSQCLHVLGQT